MKLLGILLAILLGLAAIGAVAQQMGPKASPEDERSELAAKIERVMKDTGVAMAFARGTTLNVDSVKCSDRFLELIEDVYRDRMKAVGFTEVVCTATGGVKTYLQVR